MEDHLLFHVSMWAYIVSHTDIQPEIIPNAATMQLQLVEYL